MIAASLMTIRPVLVKIFPTIFNSTNSQAYSHSSSWRSRNLKVLNREARGGSNEAGASEVELKTSDSSDGKENQIQVRTEFGMRERTIDDTSGSENGG